MQFARFPLYVAGTMSDAAKAFAMRCENSNAAPDENAESSVDVRGSVMVSDLDSLIRSLFPCPGGQIDFLNLFRIAGPLAGLATRDEL